MNQSSARNHPEKILTSTAGERFTPGPWEVCNGIDVYPVGDFEARKLIADCDAMNAPVDNHGDHLDTDMTYAECKANARLISAAPDMYEALRAWVESTAFDEQTGSMAPVYQGARAALAKAEGRS